MATLMKGSANLQKGNPPGLPRIVANRRTTTLTHTALSGKLLPARRVEVRELEWKGFAHEKSSICISYRCHHRCHCLGNIITSSSMAGRLGWVGWRSRRRTDCWRGDRWHCVQRLRLWPGLRLLRRSGIRLLWRLCPRLLRRVCPRVYLQLWLCSRLLSRGRHPLLCSTPWFSWLRRVL